MNLDSHPIVMHIDIPVKKNPKILQMIFNKGSAGSGSGFFDGGWPDHPVDRLKPFFTTTRTLHLYQILGTNRCEVICLFRFVCLFILPNWTIQDDKPAAL